MLLSNRDNDAARCRSAVLERIDEKCRIAREKIDATGVTEESLRRRKNSYGIARVPFFSGAENVRVSGKTRMGKLMGDVT